MSDLYLEELVKRRKTGTDQALRYVLMALTAIGVVLSLLTWNLIIIAVSIAICVADIFIFPRFQTEWEYQYVNGELDVDRIINKAKRKRMASYDISKAELIAPAGARDHARGWARPELPLSGPGTDGRVGIGAIAADAEKAVTQSIGGR